MSRSGHHPLGSSRRAAGDVPSRETEHHDPLTPGLFHGHPVRGHPLPSPEHLSSCTEPSASFRLQRPPRFAEAVNFLEVTLRVPIRPISAAPRLSRTAVSFGLGTLLVQALSNLHRRDAEALPTDVCHPTTSLPKLHPCSRRPNGLPGSHPVRPRRHWFTPASLLRRGHVRGGGVLALRHVT
jgi:hypothetical protein